MSHCLNCGRKLSLIERLRSGQYCSAECKSGAKEKEDQLALESLTQFGPRKSAPAAAKAAAKKEEKKNAKTEPKEVVAPPDPAWGGFVKQVDAGAHDRTIHALGFPAWVAPPVTAKKKSIEDYLPVTRVPDEVMADQQRRLMTGALWLLCEGRNPENADGYVSDFRYMVVAPEIGMGAKRRELPSLGLREIAAPGDRHCQTPQWVGGQLELSLPEPRPEKKTLPRLEAEPVPADLTGILPKQEMPRTEEPARTPPQPTAGAGTFPPQAYGGMPAMTGIPVMGWPVYGLPAPPPAVSSARPQVDAHRIVSSFPAMMQAGLVRVEPGFASVVLELRPVSAPTARAMESEALPASGGIGMPQRTPALPAWLCAAGMGMLDASCNEGAYPCRAVDPAAEEVSMPVLLPTQPRRKMAAGRAKPEVRVPVRFLSMRHFTLPSPVSEWSQ